VAPGQVFFPVLLRFSPVSIIPPVPHTRLPHKSTLARWTKERTLETLKKICSFGNRGGANGPRERSMALSPSVTLPHTAVRRSVWLTHLQSCSCSSLQIPCTRSPCLPSNSVNGTDTPANCSHLRGHGHTLRYRLTTSRRTAEMHGNCREGKTEVLNPLRLKK